MGSWEGQGQWKQEHPPSHNCEGSQKDSLSHQPQGDDVIHEEEPEIALLSLLRAWDHLGSQGFSCLRTKVGGRGAVCSESKGVGLA